MIRCREVFHHYFRFSNFSESWAGHSRSEYRGLQRVLRRSVLGPHQEVLPGRRVLRANRRIGTNKDVVCRTPIWAWLPLKYALFVGPHGWHMDCTWVCGICFGSQEFQQILVWKIPVEGTLRSTGHFVRGTGVLKHRYRTGMVKDMYGNSF